MSILFYEAPYSSASPVACVLAELAVEHERIRLDLAAGDQRKPEFLAINPNGKVPTLVVDGQPLFEALAIILWLGDTLGVERGLWPTSESPQRLAALSWTTWCYVTMGNAVRRRLYACGDTLPAELRSPAHQALAEREISELLTILEKRLSDGPFVLGRAYSLVDTALACMLSWASMTGVSIDEFAKVKTWLAACQDRPGFRAGWGG